MTTAAIIVAGGSGLRAGGELPKQYQHLGGRAIIAHTLAAFCAHPEIDLVQPVIGSGHEALFAEPVKVQELVRDRLEAAARYGIDTSNRRALLKRAKLPRFAKALDQL